MEEKLIKMGLRLEGEFTLKSGVLSHIKWDIERMFQYPQWVRIEAMRSWIYKIGLYCPNNLVGVHTGGWMLARDIGAKSCLDTYITDRYTTTVGQNRRIVVVDDVITTGNTIRGYLGPDVVAVAVLVNRSGLSDLNGIPIVTGIFVDRVN